MSTVLHAMLIGLLAFLGWVALLLSIGMVINGRAWVWARTREAGARVVRRVRRRRCALVKAVVTYSEQPVAFMPRGGWLSRLDRTHRHR